MGSKRSRIYNHSAFLVIAHLVLMVLTVQGNNTTSSEKFTSQKQVPYCYVDLLFPSACKDPGSDESKKFTRNLYALNIDFKTKNSNEARAGVIQDLEEREGWNASENKFCSFKEIPQFPPNCISKKLDFRDHVNCSNYDVFQMDRIHRYKYGLRITCIAPYPLEVKYEKSIPYEGVQVRFAKVPVINISEPYYQIQLQLPGEFKPGNLHEFSGNYTIFSAENRLLRRQLNITILPPNYGSNSTTTPDGDIPKITAADGRIKCESNSSKTPVFLVLVQASNPMETELLKSCLDTDKTCSRKIVGKNCKLNDPTCKELLPVQQQGIIRCSCGHGGESLIERRYFMGLDLYSYENFSELENKTDALINIRHMDGRSYVDHVDEPQEPVELYDRGEVSFFCYFLDYFMVPPIKWTVTFQNETETDLDQIQPPVIFSNGFHVEKVLLPRKSEFTARAVQVQLSVSVNMTSIRCRATLWNSSDYREDSLNLTVIPSEKPSPLNSNTNTHRVITSAGFNLTCHWKKVNPESKYEWVFQGRSKDVSKNFKISQNDSCVSQWFNETTQSSHLSICNANKDWNGTYTCLARNFLGNASQNIDVLIKQDQVGSVTSIYLGVACGFIVILIIGIIVVLRICKSQRARLTALEIKEFEKGNEKELNKDKMAHEIVQYLPYNRQDFEVPWKNFQTDYEELGHGAYGIVFKGQIGERIVAAKTVHPNVEKCAVLALLSELKIMIYLGKHENLVELVGACTEFLREGRPFLFVEFCSKGSLDTYLRNGRKNFMNEIPKEQRVNSIPSPDQAYVNLGEFNLDAENFSAESIYENGSPVTTTDLIRWSCQIANALEYLESRKVIHGDLATRNVLLTSTLDVKVTDFGLARQLNNYSMYVKTQDTPLPWRWLALESHRDMVFTSKSDVWSYGITLWEIFTLAEIPYAGATNCCQVVEDLEEGYRMRRPKYSTVSIYEEILACWHASPEARPSFTELKAFFSNAQPFEYVILNSNPQRLSDEGIVMSDCESSPLL